MNKLLSITAVGVLLTIGVIVGGATVTLGKAEAPSCQYPTRPLSASGECDNSDPFDPSTLKDPVLHGDCAPEESPTQAPAPLTAPTEPLKEQTTRCGQ